MSDIKISMKVWPGNYEVSGDTVGFLVFWIPLDRDELENKLSETIPDWLGKDQIFVYLEDFAHAMDVKVKQLTTAETDYLVVVVQQGQDDRSAVVAILSEEDGYVPIQEAILRETNFPDIRVADARTRYATSFRSCVA